MALDLTSGALEAIVNGSSCDAPVLQILSSKKIASGSSSDRYRILLSDGVHSYSHAMLATQLNGMMEEGEMDNLCVVRVKQYICNTLQGDRRVMILLEVEVLSKGADIGERLGNPQPLKPNQAGGGGAPAPAQQSTPQSNGGTLSKPSQGNTAMNGIHKSPPPNKPAYNVRGGSAPGTPGSNRIHSIASLTPYQNRNGQEQNELFPTVEFKWRIRARVTQKSNIRTWSNSRGEGKLFNVNLIDESGEIRATGFTDSVDKFYDMLEVNKVYYFSRATLKTANKQYSSVNNDYEMTFNNDSTIEPCDEATDLPTITFDFVKIDSLEAKQANCMIDVLGVVKGAADVTTIVGKQSQKEVSKRDIQLVDQSGMVVNMTLWGNEAENFKPDGNPVIACKGCRLSDWGGRSLSCLSSTQMIVNPDIREAHLLKGWWDSEGCNRDFQGYKSEGSQGGAGSGTNWKTFMQTKTESIGTGDKPDYFTTKGTVLFVRKENCLYQACPTEQCNKKMVDQGNGMYRCEKCSKEFPNFKWRMILSVNLSDYTETQWVTCFQDSAEVLLGRTADELGSMRDSNELEFDKVFSDATFQSYVFRLRAKMETYNDENRLKTICVKATPMDWVEDGNRLAEEINKLLV